MYEFFIFNKCYSSEQTEPTDRTKLINVILTLQYWAGVSNHFS